LLIRIRQEIITNPLCILHIVLTVQQRKGKQIGRPVKRRAPELANMQLKRAPEKAERLAQLDSQEYLDYDDYGSPMLKMTKVTG
jgi:hypothetical protein